MDKLLHYFISKCCLLDTGNNNLEPCCRVLPEYAALVKELDPLEEHFHIEKDEDLQQTFVFRKRDWLNTLARRKQLEELSIKERAESQTRKEALEIESKLRTKDFETATAKLRQAHKTDKEINSIIEDCLEGKLPNLAEKLGLTRWCKKPKEFKALESLFE